jgi:hypothetical protein
VVTLKVITDLERRFRLSEAARVVESGPDSDVGERSLIVIGNEN